MNEVQLHRIDLNLLVVFEVLMDERSVSLAARRLFKTPSAISHSLSRLREQTGDPLMVMVAGRMEPSPYAFRLIEDVRPILQSVRRAMQRDDSFDPTASHRMFRVAMPVVPALVPRATARVQELAPDVGIDWLQFGERTYADVAAESIDLVLHSSDTPLPEGLSGKVMPTLTRYTYARSGHPALENWTQQAWIDWPHVLVGSTHGTPETVSERIAKLGVERRIGARVTDYAHIAPLLAATNMLTNQVAVMLADDLDRYDIHILRPPMSLPDFTFRWVWNTRLTADPGSQWFRAILMTCLDDLITETERRVKRIGVVEPVMGDD
jgi:DNA-binding transcriptional LysR family regulator